MKDIVEKIRQYILKLQKNEKIEIWDAEYICEDILETIDIELEEQAKKTFLDRLKEEREELKERLEKLNIFLHKLYVDGTVFVTDTQAHYLKEQREYMQGYLDILDKRLKDLEEGNIVTIGKE